MIDFEKERSWNHNVVTTHVVSSVCLVFGKYIFEEI